MNGSHKQFSKQERLWKFNGPRPPTKAKVHTKNGDNNMEKKLMLFLKLSIK